MSQNNNLRLDIQGLRALAVLSVVIFHVSPNYISGGYLGVDVFFVISGYLIMGQIWRALNQNRFSFGDFYTKRFKRLLPALLVVLTGTSIAAYILLLPGEYQSYTHSVFSSLFYFSNFWFYTKSGYFDAELQSAPLLHTWSLSVEEQFYFIFPFLLVFLYKTCRGTKKAFAALIVIAITTLLLSEWMLSYDQSLSFYASPTRFWQFIVGGLLAISNISPPNHRASQVLSFTGLLILVFIMFTFNEHTPFPGFMAIPVTLATALVIYARSERGIMGWVLSNPISNFFGNISYSFYLWHWPVIIFYKIYLFDEFAEFEKIEKLTVLMVSIVLATLTYHLVENPFRKTKTIKNSYKPVILSLALTLSLSLIINSSTMLQSQRYTQETIEYESYLSYINPYRKDECFLTSGRNQFTSFNQNECINFDPQKYNILLLGDSHAEQWFSALKLTLQSGQTLSLVTASGCKPLLPISGLERCVNLVDWAINDLITAKRFDKIIIAGRWIATDVQYVEQTIKMLKEHSPNVTALGPVIEYQYPLPILLAKFGNSSNIMTYSIYEQQQQLSSALAAATLTAGGNYFPTIEYMCNGNKLTCQLITEDGIPVQFDYGHLTHEGAVSVMAKYALDERYISDSTVDVSHN